MRIYLARHGESQANILHEVANRGLKHGLTRAGRAQAVALADHLRGVSIARIYCSPLLRAIETTVILAERLGVEYEVTDALREYDCGYAEGRSDDAAWRRWQELRDAWVVDRDWARRIEGGESFHDIRARFVPFMEALVRQYGQSGDDVLCVSHGGVYSLMLPLILPNVNNALIERYGFGYTSYVIAEPRAVGLVCVEWNGQPIPPAAQTAGC
jgi:2,3-bisphosphoglycerate-dependent phosphoglycerate mutase